VIVDITETLPGIFQQTLRIPNTVEFNNLPQLIWPQQCSRVSAASATAASPDAAMSCTAEMAGKVFALDYPLFNPALATYYRLTTLDGVVTTAMQAPTEESWTVPEKMSGVEVATQYLRLGVEHIIGGYDHLLFVLGLLVIAGTGKRILLTVTGFTLAHSISLSLSALGFVSIPIVPVEATIALSIVFLAHEISQQKKDSLTWRYPMLISFGFGLLHGLGFASALGEIGLVQNEALLSLLFFNLGVETGQLLFIGAIMLLLVVLQRALKQQSARISDALLKRRAELFAAYIIGIPSAYWLIDRIAPFVM
jgi:hydrogenase/urease accessory protein HupE